MFRSIILLTTIFAVAYSVNPGMLIAVPLPYNIPTHQIQVPMNLQSFTVQTADFTNVQIKELNFNTSKLNYQKKTLFTKQCLSVQISISYMRIHFDVDYKGAYGPGDFIEDNLKIVVEFNFVPNSKKLEISIQKLELHLGKIKVSLGGTVQERFLSVVTDILINYGQIIIHGQIKNIVKKQILKINDLFKDDIEVKDVYIDVSLIQNVIFDTDFITILMNGASHKKNVAPINLNPPQLLAIDKTAKTRIQFQVHQKVVNSLITTYFEVNPLNYNLSSMSITSVIDVNSLTLSPVFPNMSNFSQIYDVIFEIQQQNTTVNFQSGKINVDFDPILTIYTADLVTKANRKQYMSPVKANIQIIGNLILAARSTIEIKKAAVTTWIIDQDDIMSEKVYPQELTTYQNVLTQWIVSYANSQLYTHGVTIQKSGLSLLLNGEVKDKYVIGFIDV